MWHRTRGGRGGVRLINAPLGMRDQSEETEAGGGNLRLVQDRGPDAQNTLPRLGESRVDVHLGRCGLQPRENAKPDGGSDMKRRKKCGLHANPARAEGPANLPLYLHRSSGAWYEAKFVC